MEKSHSLIIDSIEDPFHDKLHKRDIGILCPKCKSECTFEWTVLKTGERSIKQSC